jgi:hypothetical protein
MFHSRRTNRVDISEADRFRWAKTLLATFARRHGGIFMLDGSAIGTDPSTVVANKLDVYCVFPIEHLDQSLAEARKAVSSLGSWDIHRANRMSGFLGELARRAIVVGERRRTKR